MIRESPLDETFYAVGNVINLRDNNGYHELLIMSCSKQYYDEDTNSIYQELVVREESENEESPVIRRLYINLSYSGLVHDRFNILTRGDIDHDIEGVISYAPIGIIKNGVLIKDKER